MLDTSDVHESYLSS